MSEYGNEFEIDDEKKGEKVANDNKWDVSEEKYEELNPKQPEYTREHNTIKKPHFFNKIELNLPDKTYGWDSLRDLFYETYDDNPPEIIKKLLKYSKKFVEEYKKLITPLIDKGINTSDKKQTSFGNDLDLQVQYITRENLKFNSILKNRLKNGFRWIIYRIKSNLIEYPNKVYIGYSKNNDKRRFKYHLLVAIGPHGHCEKCEYVNVVKLHKVIRKALEKEGINWKKEWNWLENNIGLKDYHQKIDYLLNLTLNHIKIDTIELHSNFKMMQEREKYHTLNYINEDGTIGTIKNGLNEISGGGGGEVTYNLPVIDIVAMATLGKSLKGLWKKVTELYHMDIAYTTFSYNLREIFENFSSFQEEVFKPIVEKLMKDESDYNIYEISNAINMDRTTLTKYLRRWYNGRGFKTLKRMLKEGKTNWENFEYFNQYEIFKKQIKELNQVPLWLIKKWLIEGRTAIEIADEFRIYRTTVSNFIFKHPELGKNVLSKRDVKNKLRKEMFIKLLGRSWNPYKIMETVFKMKQVKLRQFIKRLFPTRELEDVLKEYSGTEKRFYRKFHKMLGVNQKAVLELLEKKDSLFLKDINKGLNNLTEDMVWAAVRGLVEKEFIKYKLELNWKANRKTKKYYITDAGREILKDHWIKPKLGSRE